MQPSSPTKGSSLVTVAPRVGQLPTNEAHQLFLRALSGNAQIELFYKRMSSAEKQEYYNRWFGMQPLHVQAAWKSMDGPESQQQKSGGESQVTSVPAVKVALEVIRDLETGAVNGKKRGREEDDQSGRSDGTETGGVNQKKKQQQVEERPVEGAAVQLGPAPTSAGSSTAAQAAINPATSSSSSVAPSSTAATASSLTAMDRVRAMIAARNRGGSLGRSNQQATPSGTVSAVPAPPPASTSGASPAPSSASEYEFVTNLMGARWSKEDLKELEGMMNDATLGYPDYEARFPDRTLEAIKSQTYKIRKRDAKAKGEPFQRQRKEKGSKGPSIPRVPRGRSPSMPELMAYDPSLHRNNLIPPSPSTATTGVSPARNLSSATPYHDSPAMSSASAVPQSQLSSSQHATSSIPSSSTTLLPSSSSPRPTASTSSATALSRQQSRTSIPAHQLSSAATSPSQTPQVSKSAPDTQFARFLAEMGNFFPRDSLQNAWIASGRNTFAAVEMLVQAKQRNDQVRSTDSEEYWQFVVEMGPDYRLAASRKAWSESGGQKLAAKGLLASKTVGPEKEEGAILAPIPRVTSSSTVSPSHQPSPSLCPPPPPIPTSTSAPIPPSTTPSMSRTSSKPSKIPTTVFTSKRSSSTSSSSSSRGKSTSMSPPPAKRTRMEVSPPTQIEIEDDEPPLSPIEDSPQNVPLITSSTTSTTVPKIFQPNPRERTVSQISPPPPALTSQNQQPSTLTLTPLILSPDISLIQKASTGKLFGHQLLEDLKRLEICLRGCSKSLRWRILWVGEEVLEWIGLGGWIVERMRCFC